mgnify:CR=1 FL=1
MKKILILLASLLVLFACGKEKVEWVQLEDYSSLDPETAFIPYAVYDNEPMPPIAPEDTKTTTFTASQMAQKLLASYSARKIRSYCGSYMGTDLNNNPVRLSGRIVIPADKKVSRIVLVSHYTMTDNPSVPSNALPLESVLAARGLAVIDADYLGYGLSKDWMHPYLIPEQAVKDVIGMYFAALPFMEAIGASPQFEDIFLMGYSQGGAVTMSVLNKLGLDYPEVPVRLVMSGAGPYDLCLTYDKMVERDYCTIPVVIPLIIRSMKYFCHLDRLHLEDYMQADVIDNLWAWIDCKAYSTSQIRAMLGMQKLSDIMTPKAMNKVSPAMEDLYLAMMEQSVLYPGNFLLPQAPLYLFHSMDDDTVPFGNSEELLDRIQGYCDVYYNFGHYGSHKMGMLRFLSCCLDLLEQKGDI